MLQQKIATIESIPMALAVVKEMQACGLDWGGGYRAIARRSLAEVMEMPLTMAVGPSEISCMGDEDGKRGTITCLHASNLFYRMN